MYRFLGTIIGNKPYDYQIKVSELLLSGKNVILSYLQVRERLGLHLLHFYMRKSIRKFIFGKDDL